MEEWGREMRGERERVGMVQRVVAERVGVSVALVSHGEQGWVLWRPEVEGRVRALYERVRVERDG